MRNVLRSTKFKEFSSGYYARRLLETKGNDEDVVNAEVSRVLFWLRLKLRFSQYFPRPVVQIFFKKIVKVEKEPAELSKKIAAREAGHERIELVEAERPE